MARRSLPTSAVIALVAVTAITATGLGYFWASSKQQATPVVSPVAQPAAPYVYMPSFDVAGLINLPPETFAEVERRCQTRQHPTCENLRSEAVKKGRLALSNNVKPVN